MGVMASQITSFTIIYSTIHSGTDQRKHQSSASLAFVRIIHRWPVNSLHKGPVTRNMFSFEDVIMFCICALCNRSIDDKSALFLVMDRCRIGDTSYLNQGWFIANWALLTVANWFKHDKNCWRINTSSPLGPLSTLFLQVISALVSWLVTSVHSRITQFSLAKHIVYQRYGIYSLCFKSNTHSLHQIYHRNPSHSIY